MDCNGFIAIVVVLLGFILLLVWVCRRPPKNFPPGPIGLPLIGYFPFLGKYPYKIFMNLSEKYGNVFSVPLGHERVVVLNDWPAIKEALIHQTEKFNGRQKSPLIQIAVHYLDVAFSDGPEWRQRRRLTLQHLKNLGLGKHSMETIVMDEIQKMCDDLLTDVGKPLDVSKYLFCAFLNIIWGIVAGRRFDRDSEIMTELIKMLNILFHHSSNTNPLLFMPYIRHIFPGEFKTFLKEQSRFEHFISKEVTEHEVTYHDGEIRDFIDAYLEEMFRKEDSPEKSMSFTKESLIQVCKDLFGAGIETSSNTVSWGLLYMATWPSIQQKVQDEMDQVVGRERLPTYEDRYLLKYTNAVILELFRYSTIGSLSITHATLTEAHLFGFTLPKDTLVIPNLWAVHHDPNYWKDPEIFNPERFFNENGEVEKPEYLIPFSVGGRMCLGESLGKMGTFLFFTCLLHRFSVSFLPGAKPPSLNPVYRLTLTPKPFSLVFNLR